MAILGGIWKKFIDLLPTEPRQVGTVTTVDGDNYTITLTGGGLIVCRSRASYTPGAKVFVVGNTIESLAPNLTSIVIEI